MAGKKKAPLWRQVFLRALRRTGNVRASAVEAGVDPGTAYDHRAKDSGFRRAWEGALAAFAAAAANRRRPRRPGSGSPRSGEELVLRRSTSGDRMVRAAPGRWCARVEESFLDGIEETGCVEAAAAAAGISTAALYRRRDRYPEFAARWDERLERNRAKLPGLLDAAAVQSMSPQPEGAKRRGRSRLPPVSVDQAIRIRVANDNAKARAAGRRGKDRPPRNEAEEREDLIRAGTALLGMLKRRREKERLAAGWTDAGNGIWLPPGWTARPPAAPPDEGDGGEDGGP